MDQKLYVKNKVRPLPKPLHGDPGKRGRTKSLFLNDWAGCQFWGGIRLSDQQVSACQLRIVLRRTSPHIRRPGFLSIRSIRAIAPSKGNPGEVPLAQAEVAKCAYWTVIDTVVVCAVPELPDGVAVTIIL